MIARLRLRSHAAYAEPAQGVHSSMYVGFGGQGLMAGVGEGRLLKAACRHSTYEHYDLHATSSSGQSHTRLRSTA